MRSFIVSVLFVFSITFLSMVSPGSGQTAGDPMPATVKLSSVISYNNLYDSLQLDNFQLSRDAFIQAMQGYTQMADAGELQKTDILSIVDFSLPSTEKRLFILDITTGEMLFNTYVAHGRNSGKEVATSFSNKTNSFKSSLGFYVTLGTYRGEHGYSLRLEGKEPGINDNAFNRGIVVHGAPYVNEKVISKNGYIGRSLGCPAIPMKLHKAIIQKIQNGSCLFLYGPDKTYASNSRLLEQPLPDTVAASPDTAAITG